MEQKTQVVFDPSKLNKEVTMIDPKTNQVIASTPEEVRKVYANKRR